VNFSAGEAKDAPSALDLTAGDFDKQFVELRKDVMQDIFTGHKVTSPMLFGVKTEGQLGGRTEMIEAYELFKATYTSLRAKTIENVINQFYAINHKGVVGDFTFIPTDPLNVELSEQTLLEIMSPDELREMQNIPKAAGVNEVVAKLRSLPRGLAPLIMAQMTPDELRALAGLQPTAKPVAGTPPIGTATKMSKDLTDDEKDLLQSKVLEGFRKRGRSKDDFTIIKSKSAKFGSVTEMLMSEVSTLPDFFATTSKEGRILQILNNDSKTLPSEIAKALKMEESDVVEAIAEMKKNGLLNQNKSEGLVLTTKGENTMNDLPFTTEISIAYSYDVMAGLGATIIDGSREFCRELVGMNKIWNAVEISELSVEVGYDVWELRGGFWRHKGTDEITPYCRHEWNQQIIRKKY